MACYHPLTGYLATNGGITFKSANALPGTYLSVPCGRCIGCRVDHAKEWALRCVHEASLYEKNCFITLTYNSEHLPEDGSLNKTHFQKFIKRLRKKFGSGVRYFQCGEYGSLLSRPHYHACLFNFDFPDKELWTIKKGIKLYTSEILKDLWSDPIFKQSYGYSTIGEVNYESASYIAKYVIKKINGKMAKDHYCGLMPEYVNMSRRPGIGRGWIDQFKTDVFPLDKIIEKSGKGKLIFSKPPRFYDKIYDLTNPEEFLKIKTIRIKNAKESPENRPARLRTREICSQASLSREKREYENGTEGL